MIADELTKIVDDFPERVSIDMFNLHAIDISETGKDDEIAKELVKQMETIGFLVLTNVPGYDEPEFLKACKALHALDNKETMFLTKDNPSNTNYYRGYQPFIKGAISHKEFMDIGFPVEKIPEEERSRYCLYEETPWPVEKDNDWIRQVFLDTQSKWYEIGLKVTRLLAKGLGKPEAFFDPWFKDFSLSTFRSIHYKPRTDEEKALRMFKEGEAQLTTPEHADSGFLTFLACFGYEGLQVLIDGKYRSVACPPNTLVVNIGDTFARLTNYRLKATFHRVVDIGVERYSSPMFFEPKYSAVLPRTVDILAGDTYQSVDDLIHDDEDEETFLFGDWLVKRMCVSYEEWSTFDIPPNRRPYIDRIQLSDFKN